MLNAEMLMVDPPVGTSEFTGEPLSSEQCEVFPLFLTIISVTVVTLSAERFENFEEHSGRERLNGLVILFFENERTEKLNLEQIFFFKFNVCPSGRAQSHVQCTKKWIAEQNR